MMSYVTGPLTVFRRSAMLKAGYFFDTKNLAEDMEIGLRLQKFGYKIKVCASARVETDVPRTVDRLVKQRDRWYRSRVYNLIKYRSLFFNRANPELGFFGLPYLFMVEILIIVLLIRLVIILASNAMEYLQLGSLLVFSARVFPQVNLDLSVETQLYFFVVTTFVVALAYYLGLGLAKYKLKRSDILPLIFQFTIYPYFIAFVYLRGIVRELLGAKPVWERVSF
jgi:cellulose synthase/poly-beta-1,6-N-acetylglucosamine synthase-like glycosyltransferase